MCLVDKPFQPASNQVEKVDKALAVSVFFRVLFPGVTAVTENGWETVLLRNFNCVNPNRFQLIKNTTKHLTLTDTEADVFYKDRDLNL